MSSEQDKKFINNMADKVIKRQSDHIDALVLQLTASEQQRGELISNLTYVHSYLEAAVEDDMPLSASGLLGDVKKFLEGATP